MCVMVVDDDPFVRESIKEILEDEGYDVITATDGADGLRVLRTLPSAPCVIVLDLMMPVMSGEEMLDALRKDSQLAGLPVVVVSAKPTMSVPGAHHVVGKPFRLNALLEKIREFCVDV
jgi:CheY-like chemotaxis protein